MATRIPAGWEGSGELRVRTTGQVPGANGVGAFRQVCQYSHMAPEDPVIFPGRPLASAVMVYAGNTAAGASSTAATIANGGDSTCWGGIADRSAYWTNALIDTRTGTPVAPTEFSIRYSANYPRRDQVQTMPAGLRLLSDQATWGCWDGTLTTYDRPPTCPPGGAARAQHLALYAGPADAAWRLSNDTSATGAPVAGYGSFLEGWLPSVRLAWTDNCIRKAATCESHMLGDGRVIDGKGDL